MREVLIHFYDTILCTALFDALLCSENNLKDVEQLLKEVHRVLKMGGTYLIISHGYPDNRLSHFKRYIDVEVDVIAIRELKIICSLHYRLYSSPLNNLEKIISSDFRMDNHIISYLQLSRK